MMEVERVEPGQRDCDDCKKEPGFVRIYVDSDPSTLVVLGENCSRKLVAALIPLPYDAVFEAHPEYRRRGR